MSELLSLSAVELARRIRAGELSPVEVVDAHIHRIEVVNPTLNALVADRFEAARTEARAAEARAASGAPLPPLLGVPCTIKEFFGVTGMPHTGGVLHRRGRIADKDATAVHRLREAGAIVLGVSNVPEGGLWMETYNDIYGRTSNPWNPRHTSGGSSGGEGALVGAGASPPGLGSDIGGSIRIPAAFCGTVGHKPSGGLVPNTGQFPFVTDRTGAFLGSGPLVRRVEDLWPFLSAIAGPDGEDPNCRPIPLGDPSAVDPTRLRVFPMHGPGRIRVRPVMREAVDIAARALEARGARIEQPDLPRLRHAFDIWSTMLAEFSEVSYDQILTGGPPLNILWQLLRLPFSKADHTFAALVLVGSERLISPFKRWMRRYLEEGVRLKAEIDSLLGTDGVLLFPPYSRPAPRHSFSWTTPFDAQCTAIFNVMESPVTVVPVSTDPASGMPVAVQVVGAQGMDHLTVAAAGIVEAATGGWRMAEHAALTRGAA